MNITTLARPLAGLLLAGGLLVGDAGLASAETGSTGAPTTPTTEQPSNAQSTTEQRCARAQHLWERLASFDEHLHDNHQRLVELRDEEAAAGHTALAERLTTRIERLQTFDDRVEARMTKLHDAIAAKCAAPADAPATTPAA